MKTMTWWTAVAILSAVLVGGCSTPVRWEKSGEDNSRQRAAMAACKGIADAEAGRMYDRDVPGGDFGAQGVGTGFRTTMARHDAVGRRDRMIADCMKRKGYTRKK